MLKIDWDNLSKADLIELLQIDDEEAEKEMIDRAYSVKSEHVGRVVYFRGIVEFSNVCTKNCLYCGIRRGNREVSRYSLNADEIIGCVKWAMDAGYGSVVLQSGERNDAEFTGFVTDLIKEIKKISGGNAGITLSLGEQSRETFREWFEAGAHRYLLRIETSDRELYQKIHPADHDFDRRLQCIGDMKEIGYQVGTGVMIGFPGQTVEHLAGDILFFKENDIDMIGMGPYVVHRDTPMGETADNSAEAQRNRFKLGIRMIALSRIFLKDINIAATTALQALDPLGREAGLLAGANIIMPIITPVTHRKDYLLYDGKPCIEDAPGHCRNCLEARIKSIGETIGYGRWGDSPHFGKKHLE